jgi:RHS repeat-associated protein
MVNKYGTAEYDYEIKDHLGNVRATITKSLTGDSVEVLNYSDYYPHGGLLPNRHLVSGTNARNNCYQGDYAERDDETGYVNFDLRMYDPDVARWFVPDPKRQHFSPYMAMGNNPVSGTDATGGEDYESNDPGEGGGAAYGGLRGGSGGSGTSGYGGYGNGYSSYSVEGVYSNYAPSSYSVGSDENYSAGSRSQSQSEDEGASGNNGRSFNNLEGLDDNVASSPKYNLLGDDESSWSTLKANWYNTEVSVTDGSGLQPDGTTEGEKINVTGSWISSVFKAGPYNDEWESHYDGMNQGFAMIGLGLYGVGGKGWLLNLFSKGGTKLLGQPITQGAKQLQWIMAKHGPNQLSQYAGKSQFYISSQAELQILIQNATHVEMTVQAGGNIVRTVDAGTIIGFDAITGKSTSIYSVITNPSTGNLITAFPGHP